MHTPTPIHSQSRLQSHSPTPAADQLTLYYRQGSSDKVYQVSIASKDAGFVVNFAFGRRGSTLHTGTKTSSPVNYEAAREIFDKLVTEKVNKGYTPAENGVPYQQTGKEGQVSGILPQLLNPIEEHEVHQLLNNAQWCMQEKKDGRRLIVRKQGDTITGINRKGLITGLPASIVHGVQMMANDCILDGECLGDMMFAFDLLHFEDLSLVAQPYQERLAALGSFLELSKHPYIEPVETAFETAQKQHLLQRLQKERKEGVVFKRLDAPYTPGRPNRGGTQLKHKFYATVSAVVGSINPQRSVEVRLLDDSAWISIGNVTIPPNHPIPAQGSVVEVRYLYAYRESNALYQPVYVGPRTDIAPEECVQAQLKYKATEEDES